MSLTFTKAATLAGLLGASAALKSAEEPAKREADLSQGPTSYSRNDWGWLLDAVSGPSPTAVVTNPNRRPSVAKETAQLAPGDLELQGPANVTNRWYPEAEFFREVAYTQQIKGIPGERHILAAAAPASSRMPRIVIADESGKTTSELQLKVGSRETLEFSIPKSGIFNVKFLSYDSHHPVLVERYQTQLNPLKNEISYSFGYHTGNRTFEAEKGSSSDYPYLAHLKPKQIEGVGQKINNGDALGNSYLPDGSVRGVDGTTQYGNSQIIRSSSSTGERVGPGGRIEINTVILK